ncbi:hypothetical protein NFI96_021809 [Prochilodus magdalenae]|nr:hypothetical protein NFI96_021809 [Prochilodus magdalenae]
MSARAYIECLVSTLGWNITIISVWNDISSVPTHINDTAEQSDHVPKTRTADETYIRFEAWSLSGSVINAGEVKRKLKITEKELEQLMDELFEVTVDITVVDNQNMNSVTISLSIVIPVSAIVATAAIIRLVETYTIQWPAIKVKRSVQFKPITEDFIENIRREGFLHFVNLFNQQVYNKRVLNLVDINDNSPAFETKDYSATVSEITEVGSSVLQVKAVDADVTPPHSTVTYSLESSAPAEFELRGDGTIRLQSRLNYNTRNLYTFTVNATDGERTDTTTVTIIVEDFDNLNPYFNHSLYQASIPENEAGPLSNVLPEPIKAQDGDTGLNQPVVYSITAVNPSKFQSNFNIDPSSGVISVTTGLDREEIQTIEIQIKAAQQDDSTKSANAIVRLEVKDVNDNSPEFDQSNYIAAIPENSPNDMFVLQAKVTDLDQGGFVGTLRVVPDTAPFSISPDGSIKVKSSAALDRETNSSFEFQIEAKENPPSDFSALATVSITLSDENDNTPEFGLPKYEGKVFTNQTVGMDIVKVEATDADEGPNGEISYSIGFGNDQAYFDIHKDTGVITLVKLIAFEENKVLRFALYVLAKDGGTVSRSSYVLVEVEAPGNSHPQFLQKEYQGTVDEEQEPGAPVAKVNFLSVDPYVPVTLAVETETDKFSIDQTGMVTTKAKLDYETQKNYTVQLSITDGTSRDTASVLVGVLDINDNSPEFDPIPSSIEVPEDAETGHNVTSVLAKDKDTGLNGELRYSLEGSAGMFSINPETGVVTVAAVLDRETQNKYNIRVVAQDQGRPVLSSEASMVVTITDANDNAPIFSKPQYEASILENATIGTDVISISATDKDEGPNAAVTYHISKQDPSSSPAAFAINATSGSISLAAKLDYGTVRKYTLEVEARDGGSPSLTGSAVVIVLVEDVKDKAPEFSTDQYNVIVYENIASGTAVVSLEVTDEDEGGFSNGHFLLTSDTFGINNQGVVHLRSNASLDRETTDNYIIQVVAVDQPVNGLSATAKINITVLDVNDNNPQFVKLTNPLEIPENHKGEVDHIQVSDADIGPNGVVTLSTYSYQQIFTITKEGKLMVTGDLDREKQDTYELIIEARDAGEPSANNFTTVTVIVKDINDNDPVFSQELYSARVLAKDVKKGDVVLTVLATDLDDGNNSAISYRFSSAANLLDLNPETGVITWTQNLTDITEDMDLELSVIAEDHGVPPRNSTGNILIEIRIATLVDGLIFENFTYHYSLEENKPKETEVGVVKALSGSQMIEVTYKLTSHSDMFSVDTSGTIKTVQSLDKEKHEWYFIKVEATDNRTPPSTAETMVVLKVENVNEAPVFNSEKYEATVFSVAPFNSPVVTIKAVDPDAEANEELEYSLEETVSSLLEVDSSGQVFVLDLTEMGGKVITAQVKATDKYGLFATAELQVDVKDSGSDNIVVIFINRPVHAVEKKLQETENALGKALGWKVKIISLRGEGMHSFLRETPSKTYISFIATEEDGSPISAEEVIKKLANEKESVKTELETVFGADVELEEQVPDEGSATTEDPNEAIVIALAVLLAVSIAVLIVLVVVMVIR